MVPIMALDTSSQTATVSTERDTVALIYVVDSITSATDDPTEMTVRPSCSGFFTDDRTVVTAAHCFYDLKGGYYKHGVRQMVVCHRGNHSPGAQCSTLTGRFLNELGIASDPHHAVRNSWDIGVLKLSDPIGAGRRLRMSRASVSVIEAEPSQSIGHPSAFNLPSCSDNDYATEVQSSTAAGNNISGSRRYVSHISEVIGSKNNILRTRHTAIVGGSGGPIYYHCPVSSVCSGSAFATGVMSGCRKRILASNVSGGPLMRARRVWVLGYME